MCLACEMEAMWFAMMEARARAAAGETVPRPDESVPQGEAMAQQDDPTTLLPPPERGRVGEGVAGGLRETASISDESEDPHPNPPPEEGGGGPPDLPERSNPAHQRQRSVPPRPFACEETSAE
jgi:hypothetical protein